jgi:hypothetical protein
MFANNTLQAQWRLNICTNYCNIKEICIIKECFYTFRIIIIIINSDWDLLCTAPVPRQLNPYVQLQGSQFTKTNLSAEENFVGLPESHVYKAYITHIPDFKSEFGNVLIPN